MNSSNQECVCIANNSTTLSSTAANNTTTSNQETNNNSNNNNNDDGVIRLKFLTSSIASWITSSIEPFQQAKHGAVSVEFVIVDSLPQLYEDIFNEARSQIGLYDGFVAPPGMAGTVVEYDGWADLSPYIHESIEHASDWSDILLGYRQWIAQYMDKIILYPLDGDLLSLFYRKDVLEHFGLSVPRTWDEYNEVAAATHGRMFDNQTLTGSCIGRMPGCAGPYWATLLISSMTQTEGPWSGHLFDTRDMRPLTGEAMIQALAWMETQVQYGADNEFDGCFQINVDAMQQGTCVLTYNWGNSFKGYLAEGSVLRGKFGVAKTPGSTMVLDRDTMKLVPCTEERCPHGIYYDDIGWLNRAPYLAYGGWSCAVNNYAKTPQAKRLATEFCAFVSSREQSIKAIIPLADTNETLSGQDPFRSSQLDLELYVSHGYERDAAQEYIEDIKLALESPNVVTDDRFPTATDINAELDREFYEYLNMTKSKTLLDDERQLIREQITHRITLKWQDIIATYDARGTTDVPVLEAYQKLNFAYAKNPDLNQIQSIRYYGFSLVALIMVLSLVFAGWTLSCRNAPVVRASQPFFLVILCIGTAILGSSIIPMGLDDSIASSQAAISAACMSIPWLLALGWTTIFAALFAKLRRVNIVYRNTLQFKRLKVTIMDVFMPFAVLLTWNITWLWIWTALTPLFWERIPIDDLSSYGTCSVDRSTNLWIVCVTMIVAANGFALLLANIEAYKARHVAVEYGESSYIALAMSSILQIMLVGLPLLFLVDDNPSASYFVRSSIIFVVCMSILVLIFVPKIYVYYSRIKEWASKRNDGSNPTGATGLSVHVLRAASSADPQVLELKKKIVALERLMVAKGIETNDLFTQAGLADISRFESSVSSNRTKDGRLSFELDDTPSSGAAPLSLVAEFSQLQVVPEDDEEDQSSTSSDPRDYNNRTLKPLQKKDNLRRHLTTQDSMRVNLSECEQYNGLSRDSMENNMYMVDNHVEDDDFEEEDTVLDKLKRPMAPEQSRRVSMEANIGDDDVDYNNEFEVLSIASNTESSMERSDPGDPAGILRTDVDNLKRRGFLISG